MRIVRQFFVYSAFVCAALFLCVLSSCNNVFYQNSDDDSSCYVRFSIADDARTVKPQKLDLETLSYSLVATNGSTVRSASWKNYEDLRNASFQMDVGVWTFTLEAYLDGRKVLSGSKKDIKISVGANKLSFTLSEPATGTGSFSMEIKIGTAPSADVITATLCDMTGKALTEADMGEGYNPETDGALTQSWTTEDFTRDDFDGTVTFAITDHVPKGAYMLTFAMTKGSGDSAVTSTFRTIAAIAAGNESTDSYDMSEGTKENPNPNVVAYYSVIYEDGLENEVIAVPEDTALYKQYEDVTVNFKDVGERTGYTFSGWLSSQTMEYKRPVNPDETTVTFEMPARNVTLTAIWTPNGSTAYTVRHWQQKLNAEGTAAAASGSDGTTDKTITEGESAGAPATCTDYDLFYSEPLSGVTGDSTAAVGKTGSGYAGFEAQAVSQKTIAADGSTVVDIFYDRIMYTVSYEDGVEGEVITVPEPASWYFGAKVTVDFTAGERTGYTFSGWKKTQNSQSTVLNFPENSDEIVTFEMPAGNVTLSAIWTPNGQTLYTVRHWKQKLNEEKTAAINEYDIFENEPCYGFTAAQTEATAKTASTDAKYAGFEAQKVSQKPIAADGSTVIDIYYNRITYRVSYNDGVGGETIGVPDAIQRCFGAKVTVDFTVGDRPGYSFTCWNSSTGDSFTQPESDGNPVTFTMGAGDITLYAVWQANTAGISVNWVNQTADMPLFTYEIGGEGNTTITFTAPAGYSSWAWYLSSQTSVASDNTFEWNTAPIASGTYYVTLVATDSAGKKWSSTMKVEVNK